jgi:single-strand DNA-binding protein
MAVASGRLQIRNWTDKDGNKRRTAEVVADNVYFGDSKNGSAPSETSSTEQLYESIKNGTFGTDSDFTMLEGNDDALPF